MDDRLCHCVLNNATGEGITEGCFFSDTDDWTLLANQSR